MMDIRTVRKKLGISQSELGGMLGVAQSVVSRYETGVLRLDARTSLALEAIIFRAASAAQDRDKHHDVPDTTPPAETAPGKVEQLTAAPQEKAEIGRAACRERVCQYE